MSVIGKLNEFVKKVFELFIFKAFTFVAFKGFVVISVVSFFGLEMMKPKAVIRSVIRRTGRVQDFISYLFG